MAVVMMGLFAQAPLLFVLAFALWLALCTASSTMLRSAWSYSFVLAGYTVAIIALRCSMSEATSCSVYSTLFALKNSFAMPQKWQVGVE